MRAAVTVDLQLESRGAVRREAGRGARKHVGVFAAASAAAKSGGSVGSSGGRAKAGPSAVREVRPTKSSAPSASVVPASARPACVSSTPATTAAAAGTVRPAREDN